MSAKARRKPQRFPLTGAARIAVVAACVVGCRPPPEPASIPDAPEQPDEAPASNRSVGDELDAAIPTADGEILELSGWRGRVVVLALSASWDGAGADGLAFFSDLRSARTGAELEVVVVSVDPVAPALDRWPVQIWPGWDPQGAVAARLRVRGFPTTFVIGRDGRLVEIVSRLDDEGRARIDDAVTKALVADPQAE